MDTLREIEAAVDSLPEMQQRELLRHLAERLQEKETTKGRLPLVAAIGKAITQQDINAALDAD